MAENAALRAVINELRGEIAELKRQLGLNSRNSSKPPSTDGLGKPAPKSLRRKSGRKPGGQPGHPGSTLALVDGVPDDRIVRHEPAACGGCGAGLNYAPEVGVVRRQVFDLPPMRIEATEHQLVTRRCGCGVSTCGPAPEGVSAPVQYGPRVTAIVLYLVHDAWAPYDTFTGIAAQQLCAAHALRELQAVAETAPADDDWCWAVQVADALVAMQRLLTDALATAIDADALAEQVRLYRAGAQIGITETAARENTVTRKHHALARRLFDRCEDYLRFTTDHVIPPDNNGSERDIRMIKIRQKVSGCLRSLTGAQQFCAIRSYLSTANKHGKQFLEILVTLAEGLPWLPA